MLRQVAISAKRHKILERVVGGKYPPPEVVYDLRRVTQLFPEALLLGRAGFANGKNSYHTKARPRSLLAMFLSGSLQTHTLPQTGASCPLNAWNCKNRSLRHSDPSVPIVPSSQEAFDLPASNIVELPAIISEEGEVVLTGRDADHEIEIRNALPLGT